MSVLNSFAWSKSIDIAPFQYGNRERLQLLHELPRLEFQIRAISDYDLPLQNTTSFVWDPSGGWQGTEIWIRHSSWAANAIIGGWRLAAINTMISGQPINFTYTPSTAGSVAGSNLPMRPTLVGDPFLPADQRTPQQYFNIAALAVPDISQPFGSAGRNIDAATVSTSSIWQSTSRFPLFSRSAASCNSARLSAFNVLNKPNFPGGRGQHLHQHLWDDYENLPRPPDTVSSEIHVLSVVAPRHLYAGCCRSRTTVRKDWSCLSITSNVVRAFGRSSAAGIACAVWSADGWLTFDGRPSR